MNELERIHASGLFDTAYYLAAYAREVGAGDPLQHYVDRGDRAGFKPREDFDPVLYRVLHPETGSANTLAAFLARSGAGGGIPRRYSRVAAHFKGILVRRPPIPFLEDRESARAQARGLAPTATVTLEAGGAPITLHTPPAGEFLQRIRDNRPFAIVRIAQGFWDVLVIIERTMEAMRPAIPAQVVDDGQLFLLAMRLCKEQRPGNGALEEYNVNDVLARVDAHVGVTDYHLAVSFKGFPTPDEMPFYYAAEGSAHADRLGMLARHLQGRRELLDATLWKRWLITGELRTLPELCRPHPVILVGPDSIAALGERWELPDLLHLRIPPENTQRARYGLLRQLEEALAAMPVPAPGAAGTRAPILLFQCGATLALWLTSHLFERFPGVFYLDPGQALNAWCFDHPDNMKFAWNEVYLPAILRNNDLESLYRRILGAGYDAWLRQCQSPGKPE